MWLYQLSYLGANLLGDIIVSPRGTFVCLGSALAPSQAGCRKQRHESLAPFS